MEQLLLILFYPVGWFLTKAFTLGKANPEKWNWRQFFDLEDKKKEEKNAYTISYRNTAAVGLVSAIVILVIYTLKQYL
ncbi:MAG TPA: hypothetical protein DCX14_04350 [Flavobacteriales bacterium]|nr:hypothetical protein [Flavobacteriales bacterium]